MYTADWMRRSLGIGVLSCAFALACGSTKPASEERVGERARSETRIEDPASPDESERREEVRAEPREAHVEPVAPPPLPPASSPTRTNAGAARCTLGEPVEIGRITGRTLDVSIAFAAPDRGLVMWSMDGSHVRARPIGAGTTLGDIVESELGHAHGMSFLSPVADRYLVVTRANMCDARGNACVHSRVYAADGSAAGPQLDETSGHELVMGPWLAMQDGAIVARATRWGGPSLSRYRVHADARVEVQEPIRCCIGDGPSTPPFPVLARDGESFLMIGWRHDEGPPVTLVRGADGAPRGLRPIPEDARPLAAAVNGEEVLVLYRPSETGGPRIVRFDGNGRLREGARAIAVRDALPPPFDEVVNARVEVTRNRVLLRRFDPAEREIGESLEVARLSGSRNASDVAFSGRDFGVAYGSVSGQEWTLFFRRAACAL